MTTSPSPAEPHPTPVPPRAAGPRGTGRVSGAERALLADRFLAVLPHLRRRIQAALPADIRDELDTVTPHQVEALHCVTRDGGCAMNDLARAQGVGLSSATALADRLIRQGLAERVSDPSDRRIVRLVATDRARTLVDRFVAAKRSSAAAMLEALDDEEAAELIRLVEKITTAPGAEDEGVVRA